MIVRLFRGPATLLYVRSKRSSGVTSEGSDEILNTDIFIHGKLDCP